MKISSVLFDVFKKFKMVKSSKTFQCWKCGTAITEDVSEKLKSLCLSCWEKRNTASSNLSHTTPTVDTLTAVAVRKTLITAKGEIVNRKKQ